ncbi:MAG: hypothetical protein BWY82_02752 [Verrucomicrobia bacterium ADurb.Bin474]|nr:MAG: hypothetical protein BWY82_02752 [Verrucomicrobia bacterium ADurb.Bin474]
MRRFRFLTIASVIASSSVSVFPDRRNPLRHIPASPMDKRFPQIVITPVRIVMFLSVFLTKFVV